MLRSGFEPRPQDLRRRRIHCSMPAATKFKSYLDKVTQYESFEKWNESERVSLGSDQLDGRVACDSWQYDR